MNIEDKAKQARKLFEALDIEEIEHF